ncbi:MAG: hypothetical protein AAF098_03900 [Pseudomonadota bacterium]
MRLLQSVLFLTGLAGFSLGTASQPVTPPKPSTAISVEDALKRVGEDRQTLTISQVPGPVMNVARAAAPDVFFNDAMSYIQNDFRVYRVSGRLFREQWHVHVREDGKVLRTESDVRSD